jgi:hypothetical protein
MTPLFFLHHFVEQVACLLRMFIRLRHPIQFDNTKLEEEAAHEGNHPEGSNGQGHDTQVASRRAQLGDLELEVNLCIGLNHGLCKMVVCGRS